MPRNFNLQKALKTQSGTDLKTALRKAQYNTQAQLQAPTNKSVFGSVTTTGAKNGDQFTSIAPDGVFTVSVFDKNSNAASVTIPPGLSPDLANLLAFQTGTTDPVVSNFPDDGNWGWYYNTMTGKLWVPRNYQGSLIYPDFVSISGTISDTQHGSRGGGTLHANATTSVAGFESAADKTNLDTNTADLAAATSAATANQLVRRNGTAGASFGGTLAAAAVTASGAVNISGAATTIGTNGTTIDRVRFGTATLNAGTVTVTDSNVTTNSLIFISLRTPSGTAVSLNYKVTITNATSFKIEGYQNIANPFSPSLNTNDNSTLNWLMLNP